MITNREIIRIHILDIIYKHQRMQHSGLVEESIYGANLIEALASRFLINGVQVVKVGANVVYPILQELSDGEEDERVLDSWWRGEAATKNRYKRYYKLTEKGYRKFEQLKSNYRDTLFLDKLLIEKTINEVLS